MRLTRPLRGPRRLLLAQVPLALLLAATGTACGSHSSSPAATLPTAPQLRAALLTAAELGAPYKVQPASAATPLKATGCAGLVAILSRRHPLTEPRQASADFQASSLGPIVLESLATDTASKLTKAYHQISAALASCTAVTLTSDGVPIPLHVSPVNFGSSAQADQLTGTVEGVGVTIYLALERIHQAVLIYLFLQFDSQTPQVAKSFFDKAATKATAVLPVS